MEAPPDQVALVSGVLNGVLSAIGCVIGGWVADRVGRWWAYFGSGILIAMVAIILAVAPRTPNAFTVGVLAYALTSGMAYAAFPRSSCSPLAAAPLPPNTQRSLPSATFPLFT